MILYSPYHTEQLSSTVALPSSEISFGSTRPANVSINGKELSWTTSKRLQPFAHQGFRVRYRDDVTAPLGVKLTIGGTFSSVATDAETYRKTFHAFFVQI